jgi:amidase
MSHSIPGRTSNTIPDAVWRICAEPLIAGNADGPLSGCRLAIKDVFAVRGYAIGLGYPPWLREASMEVRNADIIDCLLNAGADIRGIAQTEPFAYSMTGNNPYYGAPINASAPGRLVGGSSSGPASAVCSGDAEIGLGTDTAGSIRVPASYCGLYGFRPTHGCTSMRGVVPLAPSFDTVGWFARDAETLRRVADVLLPQQDSVPVTRLLLAEDLFRAVRPELGDELYRAATDFADRLGVPLASVELCSRRADGWAAAFKVVQSREAWNTHGDWVNQHASGLDAAIEERFRDGSRVTGAELARARAELAAARAALRDTVTAGTAVLQPAASSAPPLREITQQEAAKRRGDLIRLTCPASIAGLPVLTVPALSTPAGPVGLSLVGSVGSDRDLVRQTAGVL